MSVRPTSLLWIFLGAHAVNDLYTTVLPAFLPAVAEEFDLDYSELGILSFVFVALTGMMQPVLGNTADRLGRRRWMIVTGFGVGAIGFVAMATAQSYWFIVAVSLLVGLGGATYHPQATAFIVSAYPAARGKMLGLHGWGGSAGHFLAPAVTVLAVAAFNWRIAMILLTVPMLITAVTLRVRLKETTATPTVTLRGAISPQLILVALTFGLIGLVGRSFVTFFVKMLVDEGWKNTTAGILLTVILMVGAVVQPIGGRAFDRFGCRVVFVTGAAASVGFLAMFAVTSGALSLIAVAGLSFFQFALFPVSLAQASQLVPPTQTGAAIGVIFGVAVLLSASAQPLVGVLAESLGDIRAALSWQLPVGLLGLLFATRIKPAEEVRKKLSSREPLARTASAAPSAPE